MVGTKAEYYTIARFNNHRDSFIKNEFKNNKPQINADERRLVALFYCEERKAKMVVFQTGLTGSTGCVLSSNQVHPVIVEANS